MDYKMCLDIQEEYISPVKGYYTDWNPLKNRKNDLTDKTLDLEDPWQFKNILIHK
jgi:homospermidine synthase